MTSDETWGPYPLVTAGAGVALLGIFFVDAEWGAFALGSVLLVAAALRFAGYGGQLAVRSRRADMIVTSLLGAGLVGVALFMEFGHVLKPALLKLLGGP
ncbi:DUF3017 domain-containing protein [Nonomuraea sp. NPDC050310]|uniref:DUF3017 domain-containing protein n=1 Tax=unclassified Nonomuraea TaxID=2593643 RepID=UPI003403B6CD